MIRKLSFKENISAAVWRGQLSPVKPGDQIELSPIKASFTATRMALCIANTTAWAKGCQIKYQTDAEFVDPPLTAHYSREPNISQPKIT